MLLYQELLNRVSFSVSVDRVPEDNATALVLRDYLIETKERTPHVSQAQPTPDDKKLWRDSWRQNKGRKSQNDTR